MNAFLKASLLTSLTLFLFACFMGRELTLFEKIDQLKKEKKIETLSLEEINSRSNRKTSKEEAALGKLLFHEKRLSRNQNISCANCHVPEKGFSNGEALGTGT